MNNTKIAILTVGILLGFVVIAAGAVFLMSKNQWSSLDSATEFRFEDYEKINGSAEEMAAAATAGLYRFFPKGSDADRLKEFIEEIRGEKMDWARGSCWDSSSQKNTYSCVYRHLSYRKPPWGVKWAIFIRYVNESKKIAKLEIKIWMTGP